MPGLMVAWQLSADMLAWIMDVPALDCPLRHAHDSSAAAGSLAAVCRSSHGVAFATSSLSLSSTFASATKPSAATFTTASQAAAAFATATQAAAAFAAATQATATFATASQAPATASQPEATFSTTSQAAATASQPPATASPAPTKAATQPPATQAAATPAAPKTSTTDREQGPAIGAVTQDHGCTSTFLRTLCCHHCFP